MSTEHPLKNLSKAIKITYLEKREEKPREETTDDHVTVRTLQKQLYYNSLMTNDHADSS